MDFAFLPSDSTPCRLASLWTVNLGAGLDAVSGADTAAPDSPSTEPANPVHMPITRRLIPAPPLRRSRLLLTTLRRVAVLKGSATSPQPKSWFRSGWATSKDSERGSGPRWSGSYWPQASS